MERHRAVINGMLRKLQDTADEATKEEEKEEPLPEWNRDIVGGAADAIFGFLSGVAKNLDEVADKFAARSAEKQIVEKTVIDAPKTKKADALQKAAQMAPIAQAKPTSPKAKKAGALKKTAPIAQVTPTSPKTKQAGESNKPATSDQVTPTSPKIKQAGESNKPAPSEVTPTSQKAKQASALPKTASSVQVKPTSPKAKKAGVSNKPVASDQVKPTFPKTKRAGVSNKPAPSDQVKPTSPKVEKASALPKTAPSVPIKPLVSKSTPVKRTTSKKVNKSDVSVQASKPEQPTVEIIDEGSEGDAKEDTPVEQPETWGSFNFLPGCGVLETGSLGDSNAEELTPWHVNRKKRLPEATRALLGKTVVESLDEGSPGNQTGLGEGRREGAAREMRLGILPFELGSFDPSIDECSTLTPSSAAVNDTLTPSSTTVDDVPEWLIEMIEERRKGSPMKVLEDAKAARGTSKTSFFGGRRFNIGRKSKKNTRIE